MTERHVFENQTQGTWSQKVIQKENSKCEEFLEIP